MSQAVVRHVIVQEGGRIELQTSELHAGDKAEVIVVVENPPLSAGLASFVGRAKGLFKDKKAIDDFVRNERRAGNF